MCLAALAESPTTGHECGDGVEEEEGVEEVEEVEVEETAGSRGGGRGDVGRGGIGGLVVGSENGAEARECR
jgi:hypothetical protein